MQTKIETIVHIIAALHLMKARSLGQEIMDKEELKNSIRDLLTTGREDELFASLTDMENIDIIAIRQRLLKDYSIACSKIKKAEEKRTRRGRK
jgi:hypothetical protein